MRGASLLYVQRLSAHRVGSLLRTDDYIRKWIGPAADAQTPSPSLLGPIVPLSCLRRSRPSPPTLSAALPSSRHKLCSTSIPCVPRPRSAPVRETHRIAPQFDVTTPHVVYACLGGFVVLVRPPISLSLLAQAHPLMLHTVWDVLPLHPRKGGLRPFSRVTAHAQGLCSSTLENPSGRSFSGLSLVCPKYLLSLPPIFTSSIPPGPYGAGVFDPRSWGDHRTETTITLELTRVVLAIGVFAIGVELPKAYMRQHWKSLLFLLAPVMTYVWNLPLSASFISHLSIFLRGGSSPLGSFMPLSRNSTSSHLWLLPPVLPQPTPFSLPPLLEEDMPRSTFPFISDTSWQQSAVATTAPHSPSCLSHYTSPPTTL